MNATDDIGDLPIHKAATFGHWQVLRWIFSKAELRGAEYVNTPDAQGYTPIFLSCFKGYMGAEGIIAKADSTRENRLKCVRLLLAKGAEPNFVAQKVKMTPLHWAAYNDDADVAWSLL